MKLSIFQLWSFYARENIFTKKFINKDRFNHPPINPLPSREEKATPPFSSPYDGGSLPSPGGRGK